MTRWVRLGALVEQVRGSFWFVPSLSLLLALVAGIALPHVEIADDGTLSRLVFSGSSDGARSILQAIAGSVITVTSLTFSLTVVTLQLASSQFSPRLLRTFLRDLRNQSVLGILLATFLYSLTVLRTIRSGTDSSPELVPKVAVSVAYLLVLSSVISLVWFIQHIVDVIRIDTLMADVQEETAAVIDRVHPRAEPAEDVPGADLGAPSLSLLAPSSGFLLAVDVDRVASWARERGVVVALDAEPGDWLLRGASWARVAGAAADCDPELLSGELAERVAIGKERTVQQDSAFGLRQLVDVVAKALSPGINDPTTAVHAVGHLAVLLVMLTDRPLGHRSVEDDDGTLRVDIAGPKFADYLELACGQTRRYGASEPAVVHALLDLLAAVGSRLSDQPERLGAVQTQVRALAVDAARAVESEHDRALVDAHVDRVLSALSPLELGRSDGSPAKGRRRAPRRPAQR